MNIALKNKNKKNKMVQILGPTEILNNRQSKHKILKRKEDYWHIWWLNTTVGFIKSYHDIRKVINLKLLTYDMVVPRGPARGLSP